MPSETDCHMVIQIVGSAPGFPHGIVDPIEVGFFFCYLMLKRDYKFNLLDELHSADNLEISSVGTWSSGIKIWYLSPCGPLPWWFCITFCS